MIPEYVDAVGTGFQLPGITQVKWMPAEFFRSTRLTASALLDGKLFGAVRRLEVPGMGMPRSIRTHPCRRAFC